MNMEKLRAAEVRFLLNYPGGFEHPAMLEISKKHKVEKMCELAQTELAAAAFKNPETVVETLQKIVSRSSLISVFEKPKFKDALASMSKSERQALSDSVKALLHGDEAEGFEGLARCLAPYKMDKWPLMTVVQSYYDPERNTILKPTTVKGILKFFEIDDLVYNSRPSYDFYTRYRDYIHQMREAVEPSLAPSMTAFCGFLMMSVE